MKLYNTLRTKQFRRKLRKESTKEERKIWNIVRNRNILNLKFFRQYSIGKYILDFYCPQIKLCLEIDGGQYNRPADRSHDENRANYLGSLGVTILRFWNNEVNCSIEGVYLKIYQVASVKFTP